MAKHAIDYSVFGGPQNFGKWMDVHSAPSCPAEVIKDVHFVFWKFCFPFCIFDIYLMVVLVFFVLTHVTLISLVFATFFVFVIRRGHLLSI